MRRYDPATACAALADADPVMAHLIDVVGPLRMERRMQGETFEGLLRAIVGQQLSSKAAATIHQRVRALFPETRLSPKALDAIPDEALRSAGLSGNKLRALRDLAARCRMGPSPVSGACGGMTMRPSSSGLRRCGASAGGPWKCC